MTAAKPSAGAQQIQVAYQKAVRLQNAGQFQQAAQIYGAILKQRELAEPCYQMGRMSARVGRRAEAAKWFRRALKLKPKQFEIWSALIEVVEGSERAQVVAQARKQGVLLSERATSAVLKAAEEVKAGRHGKAEKLFHKAMADGTDPLPIWEAWVTALFETGEIERALGVVAQALEALPDEPKLVLMRSSLLESLGRIDEAERDALQVIDKQPYHPMAWNSLMRMSRQVPGAPHVETLKRRVKEAASDPEAVRHMSHALAKALEDQKNYGEVFEHLNRGNAMTRAKFPWNFQEDHDWLRDIIAAWQPRSDGYGDASPIFVTGLARSGTTLVETILAAHGSVVAGSEAGVMTPLLREPLNALIASGAAYDAAGIGRAYVAGMRKKLGVDDPATRMTDKSISTYATLGHVSNALPKAKFVVLERDRRDVALSIYKNLFRNGTHRYANDLGDIARQIRLFDGAIAAWRKRVPDAIHVVDYQALTADPEPHIRALLEFCDLDWDPACLTPERTDRKVFTLSSVQVRQPINQGSVGAWKRFEDDLAPLVDALANTSYDFG